MSCARKRVQVIGPCVMVLVGGPFRRGTTGAYTLSGFFATYLCPPASARADRQAAQPPPLPVRLPDTDTARGSHGRGERGGMAGGVAGAQAVLPCPAAPEVERVRGGRR